MKSASLTLSRHSLSGWDDDDDEDDDDDDDDDGDDDDDIFLVSFLALPDRLVAH